MMLARKIQKPPVPPANEARMLHEAFSQFKRTSFELERSYKLLKEEVKCLQAELAARNMENRRLREEAERNNRLKAVGEMAARMAHELRNPLGAMELFTSLLKKSLLTEEGSERLEWASHLGTAIATMDHTITNLLLFTRKPKAQLQRIRLKGLIQELLLFVGPLLRQNQIECLESYEALPERLDLDEHLIRQALLNLILNAIDAMPQGGRLLVRVSLTKKKFPDKPEIGISLQDSGSGIPEDLRTRIFDPFFTTKGKGSGLGLSIAQNALAAHGGLLQLESREGIGSTFTLRLPMSPPENHPPQSPEKRK